MAYELGVSTSSIGAFTSLWGFHRFCFREERPDKLPVLWVSDNVAAHTTSPDDRINEQVNLVIVEEFYFMAILSILLSFTFNIIPPSLRDDEEFLSYFRGDHD